MAVTIADVAKAAGVSPATVSLVVNGGAARVRIAEATRSRVLAVVEQLGYVADPRVRALRRGETRTILAAFVARQVPDAFFVDILHGVEEAAAARGRDVQFQLIRPAEAAPPVDSANGASRPPLSGWETLRAASKAAAGVILVGSLPEHPAGRRPLHALPVPAVQIGAGDHLPGVAVVRVDNHHAGRIVAEHLLALGHRTTAILGPSTWYAPFVERREGYLQAIRAAGAPEPAVISESHPDETTLARLRASGATAVVCLYDRLALALLRQARLSGVRVPEDVSVAGFDDMDWSALLSPALTTVHIPRARMAAAAVERLEALIGIGSGDRTSRPHGAPTIPTIPTAPAEPLVIVPELIVRESTAPPTPRKP